MLTVRTENESDPAFFFGYFYSAEKMIYFSNHMLRLTRNARLNDKKVQQLRDKTRELLSGHNPQPSLVHGGKFVCVHSTNLRTVFHFTNKHYTKHPNLLFFYY